ncbi:tripartite tricarboxylate transporter TctB family protein [Propylenella binzhouense]|uniref:Tripartite tricarboxylate transporter TctB family protein n=1 Tax=Propylenella binzhouense TaxID=2555902 RepID=A0A964WUG9_9HYPH|nr:tripartite tricarboxylate transporter TctB family protein [Propylenella binzhouense]MYZ49117.1 tripartite tricarboxylate transporter TctB family protein [Propylenella binzhouense]
MRSNSVRGAVDFYSGLLLAVLAVAAIFLLRDLEIGTASDMGPGYFPVAISIVLLAVGVFLIGRGLVLDGPQVSGMNWRPILFVSLSLLAFALLVDRAGLPIAIVAQVAIATLGSSERSFLQSLLFGIALAAASSVIFVRLLGVPMRLFP